MALSVNQNTEYSLGDEELTQSNATIMPAGTNTYTIQQGHCVVAVRFENGLCRFTLGKCSSGSRIVAVRPDDVVWDINSINQGNLKISTGGNDFVNLCFELYDIDSSEQDFVGFFMWNGLLRIL